ncbi:Protein JINGUBANG [Vitis vinifera]|uniref:Protein JINGUBANG n=1 Tax=Vitis vinifera TaxID=29760 RepID=A0A438GSL2_VITVI|nr:Protein JINGUBANG [Vitis vinifera]
MLMLFFYFLPIQNNTLLVSSMNSSKTTPSTPLLSAARSSSSSNSDGDDDSPVERYGLEDVEYQLSSVPVCGLPSYKSLAVLSGHVGSVPAWPYALVTVGHKVFTAHQDSRIRVWKVSRRSENVFRLVDTLPTTKDYLGKFMKQSNYVQTRRHHKRLWIEHADSISCLTICNGLIYSGSWDKTLKVWRIADLKCLESIKAHDDAINGLVSCKGGGFRGWRVVYGGGSDGYVMEWEGSLKLDSWKLVVRLRHIRNGCFVYVPNGGVFMHGSADKSIGIWRRDADGGLCRVGIVRGHEGPVKCLQASPHCVGGGFLLYSGSLDRSLRVWWVPKDSAKTEEKNHPTIQY